MKKKQSKINDLILLWDEYVQFLRLKDKKIAEQPQYHHEPSPMTIPTFYGFMEYIKNKPGVAIVDSSKSEYKHII